jgi:hypothetical protein
MPECRQGAVVHRMHRRDPGSGFGFSVEFRDGDLKRLGDALAPFRYRPDRRPENKRTLLITFVN